MPEVISPEAILPDAILPEAVLRILIVIGILVLGFVILRTGVFIINKVLQISRKKASNPCRLDTIAAIFTSLFKYLLVIVTICSVLFYGFNFDARQMIAALGISGLILGLSMQSLIKDIVNGLFICMENQFFVGEEVTIKGMKGTVTEMGLRSTTLVNHEGDVYIIPNNEITVTINHSRKQAQHNESTD